MFSRGGDYFKNMAFSDIPGVDVRVVSRISAESLAPGTDYGRLTLWSKSAVEKIAKENLFNQN